MSAYDQFAAHYDTLMGDRAEIAADINKFLRRYAPRARSVLELGCGTGSILKHLAKRYDVMGVDLSASMLKIARKKLPGARLERQNIAQLKVDKKFDVILCLFDTMNHLPKFRDWAEVFHRAAAALNPGGVFIFDINTVHGLKAYSERPSFAEIHAGGVCVFDANPMGTRRYRLDLRLLKKESGGSYRLYKTSIVELAIPTQTVLAAVKKVFARVRIIDAERSRPSARSEELYFICRK